MEGGDGREKSGGGGAFKYESRPSKPSLVFGAFVVEGRDEKEVTLRDEGYEGNKKRIIEYNGQELNSIIR